jgi:hypothetical protein
MALLAHEFLIDFGGEPFHTCICLPKIGKLLSQWMAFPLSCFTSGDLALSLRAGIARAS